MLAIAALLVSPLGAQPAVSAEPARPNIVVFLVDDMGIMDTSVPFLTGPDGRPKRYPLNDYYRTPNMERLARNGIRFNNFQAMSVCSPTRVSIMTGQTSARHRTTNFTGGRRTGGHLPAWNARGLTAASVTLPRLLAAGGYRTIHVGKAHFAARGCEGCDPLVLGYDVNIGGSGAGMPGSYYGKKGYGGGIPGLNKYRGTSTFLTDALTIEARKQLDEAVKTPKPFYLYLAHYAVHCPFNSDPRFADHYKDSGKPEKAQAFATLIEGMDQSLGEILAHLDKLGVAENTLILFMGDNGSDAPLGTSKADKHTPCSSAPLRGKKGTHYEGGVRVPFIAAWANPNPDNPHQKRLPIKAGAIQSQLASVCDIFPTVLGLADIEKPKGHVVNGARLDTLLTGAPDRSRPEEFLMHFPHGHNSSYYSTYRLNDWKVIYHYFPSKASEDAHYQLYNLKQDPFEARNLAGTQPAQLKTMMRALIAALDREEALYSLDDEGRPMRPQFPSAEQ